MYISAIGSQAYYNGHGMEFDTLDQAADAIQRLGVMLNQNPVAVDELVVRMRSDIANRTTTSTLAQLLMRQQPAPVHVMPSGVAMHKGGMVTGGRFFAHNDNGLTRRAPFSDLEIRVAAKPADDDQPEQYLLTVTDNINPVWKPGLAKPNNHTECLLFSALTGKDRPLKRVSVQVNYIQAGPLIEFDFAQLLEALGSIDGIDKINLDPAQVAQAYYRHMLDTINSANNHYVDLGHASGVSVRLDGCFGIKTEAENFSIVVNAEGQEELARKQLIALDGTVMSGPKNSLYNEPCARVSLYGGEHTTNQQLHDLQGALETALWSYNY